MTSDAELKGPASKLFVLDTPEPPVINKEQVYIPFTSVGMCQRLKKCKGRSLKLDVDGKQKVVANSYGMFTLGFFILRQKTSWTVVREVGVRQGAKRGRIELHSSTCQPFLQALTSSESAQNVIRAFQDGIWICKHYGNFDLVSQIVQLHKDYAKGIENARVEVFSMVRGLDDYFHMMQNSPKTLETQYERLRTCARCWY